METSEIQKENKIENKKDMSDDEYYKMYDEQLENDYHWNLIIAKSLDQNDLFCYEEN